jgi:hypothetical protein
MANADTAISSDRSRHSEKEGGTRSLPQASFRKPPAMRVVTKGWLTMEESEVDIETLKKQDGQQP